MRCSRMHVILKFWSPQSAPPLSISNYAQMCTFFERLHAGLPVTVLAVGTSITSGYGGCFHRNRYQKLSQRLPG